MEEWKNGKMEGWRDESWKPKTENWEPLHFRAAREFVT